MSAAESSKTLNLYPIDYPFETLYSRIKSEKPKLILDPEFQRKYKWDKDGWERASRFIESCLMRIPLPSCYFAEVEDGRHEVIDGVQRLTTIVRFFDNEFSLEGLTAFKELEGKYFSDLGRYKTELEATTIRCIVLRKENPKALIREIFARLNQGAVELSDQEIRNAIYPGKFTELLKELAQIEAIARFAMGENGKSKRDSQEGEEQVLRYFALKGDLEGYQDKLSKYLDWYIAGQQDISEETASEYKENFKSTFEKCVAVFEGAVFVDTNKKGARQSMVHYDLLMYSFSELSQESLMNKKEEIKAGFSALCKMPEFQKTLSSGLQNKGSILKRRKLWGDILKGVMDG